jgi:hypothetical protein
MKLLQKNYEHCFPQCVVVTGDTHTGYQYLAGTKQNALTFSDFKKLYNECGEVLHRGTIKSLAMSQTITKGDLEKVPMWHSKIIDLLNEHIIWRANKQGFYYVMMRTALGPPQCTVFNSNGRGGFDVKDCFLQVNINEGQEIVGTGSSYLGG